MLIKNEIVGHFVSGHLPSEMPRHITALVMPLVSTVVDLAWSIRREVNGHGIV